MRFSNNGSIPPGPGDIIIFDKSKTVGHVAIVREVTGTAVKIIEQNWSRNNCYRELAITHGDGKYFIETKSGYIVLGWLSVVVGAYPDGWHFDGTSQAFYECFKEFSKFLGSPYDNGGGICIHKVGSVKVQDFKQDMSKPHYGDDGKTCIILNERTGKVGLLRGYFWGKYKEIDGFNTLGAPNNNGYGMCDNIGRTIIRQDFEKGYMTWDDKNVEVASGSGSMQMAIISTASNFEIFRAYQRTQGKSDQEIQNRWVEQLTGKVQIAGMVFDLMPLRYFKQYWQQPYTRLKFLTDFLF